MTRAPFQTYYFEDLSVGMRETATKTVENEDVIGFAELSYNAKVLNNSTFQPFLYFGSAALLYFAMCYPLSRWSRALERKLHAHRR